MKNIKVAIADDHIMFRQGLCKIIELENDIEVINEFSNGQELIDNILTSKEKPDIILIDINMPVLDGINAIKVLKQKGVDVKIIVITFHTEKEYIVETLKLGVNGYVLKDADSDILITAIREVYNGKNFVQQSLNAQYVFDEEVDNIMDKISNPDGITQREIEVLRLIAQGLLNKEIAKKLYISEKTVKNHVSNIFKKINVADRTQAAIYAIKNKLV